MVRRNLYPPAAWLEYASRSYWADTFRNCMRVSKNHNTYCSKFSEKVNKVSSLTIICNENLAKIMSSACLKLVHTGWVLPININTCGWSACLSVSSRKINSRFHLPSNPKSLTRVTQLWENFVLPCGVLSGPAKWALKPNPPMDSTTFRCLKRFLSRKSCFMQPNTLVPTSLQESPGKCFSKSANVSDETLCPS